jgi:anthranilate phosphoribosyltransferase
VHGAGKLDEVSLAGPTLVAEVKEGSVNRYEVTPEDFGVEPAPLESIRGGTPAENAELIRGILGGQAGPQRDIVVINAAAALVAAGVAKSFREGARMAEDALSEGLAAQKLEAMRSFNGTR